MGKSEPYFVIIFKRCVEVFVLIWAFWTIFCHFFVHFELSFNDLFRYSFFPFISAALAFLILSKRKQQCAVKEETGLFLKTNQVPVAVKWSLAFSAPLMYWATSAYFLFWILSLLVLLLLYFDSAGHCDCHGWELVEPSKEAIAVLFAIFVAIFLTMVSHRPDSDDALYLNMAVASLDQPDQPLLKYDGLHGITGAPLLEEIYKAHSYEVFVALVSRLTSVEPIYLYHLVFPIFSAFLVVIAHWLVLRAFQPATCLYSLYFVLLIFACWGDAHRTPANFSLVRLFQGKSIMVSVCIPLIIYFTIEFVKKKDLRHWLLLSASLVTAVGFSSSGFIVAPLAMLTVLLGSLRLSKVSMATFMMGLGSSFYLIIMACAALFYTSFQFGSTYTAGDEKNYLISDSLELVLGGGMRKIIALLSIVACCIGTYSSSIARFLAGIMLATMLIVLSPWSADFLAHNIAVDFRWRLLWAIPFPLLTGLFVGGLLLTLSFSRFSRWVPVVFVLLCVFYASLPGTWTVSEKNGNKISYPSLKVGESYPIAKHVKHVTPDKGMVLAPQSISVWLVTFRNYPYVIVAKHGYLNSLAKHVGNQEMKSRLFLADFVADQLDEQEYPDIFAEIRRREIDTIVLRLDHSNSDRIGQELDMLGYSKNTMNTFGIWNKRQDG